jgi:hypothetical protein
MEHNSLGRDEIDVEQVRSESEEEKIKINFFTFFRSGIILIGLATLILNSIYGFAFPNGNPNCLTDELFEMTAGLNHYFSVNTRSRHILIAFSSLCVDFVILYMGIHWALYGKSYRPIVCLAVFYTLRGFVQVIIIY